MKTLLTLLLAGACARAAAAPPDIDKLIAAASTVPAEFAADVLIRVAGMEEVPRARRIELLQQAFQRAKGAQQRYKLRPVMTLSPSVPYLTKAYEQNLDGLDLELRAVEAMAAVDAPKARELFQKVPAPDLPKLKCEAWLAYDVDRYYRTLSVLGRTFTAEEKAGKLRPFLEPPARAVASPVEAAPMAEAIAGAEVSDADFQALVGTFAAALGRIAGDDRSFTYAKGVGPRIEALVRECGRRKLSALPLLESYRLYLVVNLGGARCADNGMVQSGMVVSALADAAIELQAVDPVQFFNDRLRVAPLLPIQEQEWTPSRVEGVAEGLRGCTDAECVAIAEGYRGLVLGKDGTVLGPAQWTTPEWRARLMSLMEAVGRWKTGARTTAAEHFREKESFLNDLASLAPAGELRDAVAVADLDFILQEKADAANRIEWFLPLNRLLWRMALDGPGTARLAEKLRQSDDPVVALYVALEAMAPRRLEQLMPIF